MDYDLSRVDYTICGITYPDTLKILPGAAGPKVQQKFAVGDKNGVLQCLSIKDEEPVVHFKTLPGKPITSVQLASTVRSSHVDKIFAASGNEVKGYTRKGKVFLSIETSLSETITSMCVMESDLVLSSGRRVSHYRDLREVYSYNCEDRVLDIAAFAVPNSTRLRLLVLIANKGAAVFENGQQLTQLTVSAGPSRLAVPPAPYSADFCAFYGAVDGSIGLLSYEESSLTSKCLVEGRGLGSVVCAGWFVAHGNLHLAIGRHDGSVQLYLVDLNNIFDKLRLKFSYFCGEPVTSVAGGCVGTEESELIATSFSGRVFALRPRGRVTGAALLASIPVDALASRRAKLESEVVRLEKQAANEREKYQRNTHSVFAGLSTPPLLDIQYELSGATRYGWQEANITSAVPLDMLFVYCDRKLDMQTDSVAVLSICPSQGTSSDFLATVRCQAGTRRLWVRFRQRRQHAESLRVLVYTLPAGAPRVARLMTLRLSILPYYTQHEDPEIDNDQRSWCHLHVSGSFSVAEMTSWLSTALPGDIPRPAASMAFARRHTLLRTLLVCRYQRGDAVIKSDNVSTIAVLRDIVSNCSVEKSIHVEITCDIPLDCCVKTFENIEDLFTTEFQKNKDISFKKAISALDLDGDIINDETPVLCGDYLKILKSSNDLEETDFQELVETVKQWYLDWNSLSLHSVVGKSGISQLYNALCACELNTIKCILTEKPLNPE